MREPLVTVGMPIYNDEHFADRALSSLRAQTFSDFELIIADNASTDGTPGLCRRHAREDARIRYVRHETNIGLTANLRYLVSHARGRYFMWAASDDRWDVDFIASLVAALEADPGAIMAFGSYQLVDEAGRPIAPLRRPAYAGRHPVTRVARLITSYDDGCFYGLYRRAQMDPTQLYTWWSINATTPWNNAYPFLFHCVSLGNYVSPKTERPLWFNTIKQHPRHHIPYARHVLRRRLAFLLLKINVLVASSRAVWVGSRSLPVLLICLPMLTARAVYELGRPLVLGVPGLVKVLTAMRQGLRRAANVLRSER